MADSKIVVSSLILVINFSFCTSEWKNRISLVLEENEFDSYVSGEVRVPEGDEAKALHKKNLVKCKRIIVDSITLYHKCLPLRHVRICFFHGQDI